MRLYQAQVADGIQCFEADKYNHSHHKSAHIPFSTLGVFTSPLNLFFNVILLSTEKHIYWVRDILRFLSQFSIYRTTKKRQQADENEGWCLWLGTKVVSFSEGLGIFFEYTDKHAGGLHEAFDKCSSCVANHSIAMQLRPSRLSSDSKL